MITSVLVKHNPMEITHKRMKVQEFIGLESVSIQRNEKERYKKTMKVLSEKPLPTHLEVAVVIPTFDDDYYQSMKPYRINGNTRAYVWEQNPELIPNDDLYVTVYWGNSKDEINEIYRSIDSYDAVETPKQMMGGIFRDTKTVPKSKFISGASFTTGLRQAFSVYTGDRNKLNYDKESVLKIKNREEFDTFFNELMLLDEYYFQIENDKDRIKKYRTGPIFASLLVIAKKYGFDNPKVHELVDNLFSRKAKQHDGINGLNDGISIINFELYDYYSSIGKWTMNSGGFGPVLIGNFLFCMEAFMKDILLPIRKSGSKKGIVLSDKKAKDYFTKYYNM